MCSTAPTAGTPSISRWSCRNRPAISTSAGGLGLDQLAARELQKLRNAVFVISTTGDGEMPFNAVRFWEDLVAADFPRLERLRFGVLALGESVYEEFCAAGIALDGRLGALEFGPTKMINITRSASYVTSENHPDGHAGWVVQSNPKNGDWRRFAISSPSSRPSSP
ncbi:MAG TPA: flavodoxin domain-containing protein [Solirubrobacteraceae bacterium]|nr:flavodoxin domain-containing protein [Solirubrobacteraceae bacterium]